MKVLVESDSGEIPRLISMERILTDRSLREQCTTQGERFAHEQYAVRVLAAHLARLLHQMG